MGRSQKFKEIFQTNEASKESDKCFSEGHKFSNEYYGLSNNLQHVQYKPNDV